MSIDKHPSPLEIADMVFGEEDYASTPGLREFIEAPLIAVRAHNNQLGGEEFRDPQTDVAPTWPEGRDAGFMLVGRIVVTVARVKHFIKTGEVNDNEEAPSLIQPRRKAGNKAYN